MKKAAKVMALMVLAGGTAAVAFVGALNTIVEYAEHCAQQDRQEYQYTHYDDGQYD